MLARSLCSTVSQRGLAYPAPPDVGAHREPERTGVRDSCQSFVGGVIR